MAIRPLSRTGTLLNDPDSPGQSNFNPANYGWLGWTYDLALSGGGSSTVAAGVLHLDQFYVPVGLTISNLMVAVQTIGATLSNCFAGVYSASGGAAIASTADQSAAWSGTTGVKTMALAASIAVAAGSYIWLGYLTGNGSTTPPQFGRLAAGITPNAGTRTGTTRRNADYSSALTALPSLTLGSLADSTRSTWWAIS